MADTYQSYSNAGQTSFAVPFPYLNKSHVKVFKGRDIVADTQTSTLSDGTDYNWASSGTQITLTSALGSGEILTVERQTPSASQLSPWSDGSNLTAEELNNADLQNLYIVQEQKDRNSLAAAKSIAAETASTNAVNSSTAAVNTANAALPKAGGTMSGPIAMGTSKITGLGDPTAAQDAVTKAYLERTGSIQSAQIADGTIVNDDVNASAAIAQSKLNIANATTSASGYMSAADKTHLDSCDVGAKDDQTAAEIKTLVDAATDSNVYTDAEKTKLAGCDIGAKDDQTASEIRALVESATDSNVFTDTDHSRLNAIEDNATQDQTAAEIKTAYESLAQTNPLTDAEKSVIDGVTANTSEINALDGYTGNTTNLNIVAGKSFRASTDGALSTTSDTEMPSSKVVANHVAAQIGTVGGFTTIVNDASFPATASQPANGVIISISDAQGIVVSGTTSTTGRTVDSTPATVTINNFPSSLTGETLASGVGLLVTSTGSGNVYNYHKLLAAESDVKQLSDDINDFNARYRIAASAPGSNNDDGDLWFDTSAKKMKVYNGTTSAWDDVASVGNFFINTLSSSSGTGGGNANFATGVYRFTLSNPPTMAQQLIVSVNGVIQRPNSGTSQPSEGFAISGNDIIFSAAPASGSDYFIVTQGSSVSIGTPSDNTVTAGKIVDGSIANAKISNSANIALTKLNTSGTADNTKFLRGDGAWTVVDTDVSGDTSPQLGGDLDVNTKNIIVGDSSDGTTDDVVKFGIGVGGVPDLSIYSNGSEGILRTQAGGTIKFQCNTGSNSTENFMTLSGAASQIDISKHVVFIGNTSNGSWSHANSQFGGKGGGLTHLNLGQADNTGTVATARLGSGTANSGTFLAGDNTWQAISAAPEITATASGAIAAHKPVIVKSDGKITEVAEITAATSSTSTYYSGSGYTEKMQIAYDTTNDKVCCIFGNSDENRRPYAVAGTISGDSISWGTPIELNGFNNSSIASECSGIQFDASIGQFVAFAHNQSPWGYNHSNGRGRFWRLWITGTNTLNQAGYDMTSPTMYFTTNTPTIALEGNGNGFYFYGDAASHSTNTNTYAVHFSYSTSSFTQGTPFALGNIASYNQSSRRTATWNSADSTYVVASQDQSSPYSVRLTVYARSSNTLTLVAGPAWLQNSSLAYMDVIAGNGTICLVGTNTGSELKVYLATVSGSSITNTAYNSGTTVDTGTGDEINVEYYESIDKFFVSYEKSGTQYRNLISYSGVSATAGTPVAIQSSVGGADGLCYDPDGNRMIHAMSKSSGSGRGISMFRVEQSTNLNEGSFIGFASTAISDTASGTVAVTGNTTTQSGLTTAKKYYVTNSGGLSVTAGDPSVEAGIALSSTKLLIKG